MVDAIDKAACVNKLLRFIYFAFYAFTRRDSSLNIASSLQLTTITTLYHSYSPSLRSLTTDPMVVDMYRLDNSTKSVSYLRGIVLPVPLRDELRADQANAMRKLNVISR
jgi:hypothetical protein